MPATAAAPAKASAKSSSTRPAGADLKPGDQVHGFTVLRVTPLKNLRATALELEHAKSGARLLHVHSQDSENLFCVAFRTPPRDDTGLPHILEHSVLGGSKKYPVKDPFKEMVNMSMATFINAMTYPDKTVYPAASNVKKDFFNLADVYCDAVFHPRISAYTLKQEGHHLEFEKKDDPATPLIVKGIVFNEMKGAYSSADDFVDDRSFRWLFPSTPYGKDSGGDPERIPDLTYRDFKRFYGDLYHPSNAFIFIFGDIPTVEHLAFLQERLKSYTRKTVRTPIPKQSRWKTPRARTEHYPIGKDEKSEGKAHLTLNWLAGDNTDPQEVMALTVLDLILLGNEAAPLRKALVDSKLGEDLTSSGFSAYVMEGTFHVGLKGSEPGRLDALRALVTETLSRIVKEGIPRERVEAAFHQLGYRFLEIQSMFPLWLMDRAYRTWIYGADPLAFLRADEHLEELKRRYAADPALFTRLIRERLLDNPHRMDAIFLPDRELQARKDAKFAARMKKIKSKLKPAQVKTIVSEARKLEKLQATPNSPKALATLPQLRVRDLPAKPRHIPTTVETIAPGLTLLRNDVFSNGVNYLHLAVDLAGLPDELYPYLPLYGDGVQKMGAAGMDFAKMAERVVAHTGGVGFSTTCNAHVESAARCLRFARFTLKALDGKIGDALGVLRDLLFELDFRDAARFKDVLVQAKAAHRSALVGSGLGMALRHAGRHLNPEAHLAEVLGGLPQTRLIERLADEYDARREECVTRLEALRGFLLNRTRLTASFTGSDGACNSVKRALSDWAGKLKGEPVQDAAVRPESNAPRREGLAAPMEVAFCAQVIPAPHLSHPDSALLSVGSRMLSLGYLWEEIRIKGGAYGGGCGYNGIDSTFQFYSYRDPAVKKTLETFASSLNFVKQASWTRTDVDRAVIGTAKGAERPIRPSDATGTALWRHLAGDTPERREVRHAALLRAAPKEVKRALLEVLEANLARGGVCVVSSRPKLEAANLELAAAPLAIEDIMK